MRVVGSSLVSDELLLRLSPSLSPSSFQSMFTENSLSIKVDKTVRNITTRTHYDI